MLIITSKNEKEKIKGYLETILICIPEEVAKANKEDIENDIEIMTPKEIECGETIMTGYKIPEEYVLAVLDKANNILVDSNEEIIKLINILKDMNEDDAEELVNCIKETITNYIVKKEIRKKAFDCLNNIVQKLDKHINEDNKKEGEM